MRNKRSSNFSDDKLVRLTVNIFSALLNKRSDSEFPTGAPRTFLANAESLGREVDCDFQKSSRPKSFLGGVVAEIDIDLIRHCANTNSEFEFKSWNAAVWVRCGTCMMDYLDVVQ